MSQKTVTSCQVQETITNKQWKIYLLSVIQQRTKKKSNHYFEIFYKKNCVVFNQYRKGKRVAESINKNPVLTPF